LSCSEVGIEQELLTVFQKGIAMKKRMLLFVVLIVAAVGSPAFALVYMGAPTAGLLKGQNSIGLDYTYSESSLKFNHGRSPGGGPSFTMNRLKTNIITAKFSRGLTDNWEIFGRIGGGSARGDDNVMGSVTFNNNHGYGLGLGTKATFLDQGALKWGALFQILWGKTDGEARLASGAGQWNTDIEFTEIQIATGPNYRVNEKVSVYGGPFFHIFDGRLSAKRKTAGTGKISYDIDEGSVFGGYIGTAIDVAKNIVFNVEYMHTAAADAIGIGLIGKF